jgi:ribosome-binding factor A
MSSSIRQERIAELLFEELSIMISGELDDPRLSMAEVTHVEISKDLRNAKVYVHHRDAEVPPQQLMKGLQRAMPYLRSQLAERCGLRVVPELLFHYDNSPAAAARIDKLLQQIAQEREESRAAE